MKEGTATRADKEMLVAMNVTAEKSQLREGRAGRARHGDAAQRRSAAVAEKMRHGPSR